MRATLERIPWVYFVLLHLLIRAHGVASSWLLPARRSTWGVERWIFRLLVREWMKGHAHPNHEFLHHHPRIAHLVKYVSTGDISCRRCIQARPRTRPDLRPRLGA